MRMAYRSTNAEMSAIKWIAREDMVKGGVYMLEYKKVSKFITFYKDSINFLQRRYPDNLFYKCRKLQLLRLRWVGQLKFLVYGLFYYSFS